MSDFHDLIRSEHARKQQIEKSAPGQIVRPPEKFEESSFVPVVIEGLRRRFAAKPPVSKELKIIKGRKLTFEDILRARASGHHTAVSDQDYPWVDKSDALDLSDLAALVEDLEL